MKTFNIGGTFTVYVDFEIEAETEAEAEKIAKQRLIDQYYLDAVGGPQVSNSAVFKLYVDEEE